MSFLMEDPDKLFSYYTRKQVNIQDRSLGITQLALTILMSLYIIFGVLLHGYLEVSEARGATVTHVKGDALAISAGKPMTRYFSAEEITFPGLENGNVFVATRQRTHHQKRGTCEDHWTPCSVDGDCTPGLGGTCTPNGYCNEPTWCSEGEPEVYELEVSGLQIWVKSSIQFIMRDKSTFMYSTDRNKPFPEKGYNIFSVRDLLMQCKPVPVRYEEISELGCAIEVQFLWNCNVARGADRCDPEIQAKRLDVLFDPQNIGFSYRHADYISADERMLHEKRGVRIFLRTTGRGEKASVSAFILKAATTTSLLSIADILADIMLLYFFTHRKKFKARKYEVSPDFSDYMEKLKAKHDEQKHNPVDLGTDDRQAQEREANWMRRVNEED
mmetsp:Transcript_55039/g.144754  ORF Transcript_55039/g.144754 Transcript_55039/m.144754 type:complete len:386 (+) Transcript_55039:178-1335(+)